MQPLSERCIRLNALITPKEKDDRWLHEACWELRIDHDDMDNAETLRHKWNDEWGRIDGNAASLVWSRPDHGPAIIDDLPIPFNVKLIKVMLRASLMVALKECGHLSYVESGYPEEWRRCTVLRGEQPMERVLRACAITNLCFALDESGKEFMLAGQAVRIVVEEKPTSFF